MDVPTLVIRELTGDKREIYLTGRALPERPIEFSGEQQLDVSNYPGSPISTAQVLGAREAGTTLRGWWKERYVAEHVASGGVPYAQLDYQAVNGVRELAELFDDVRRKGQMLLLQWAHLARHGHLKRFTQKWHTVYDLEWEAEFVWVSQAETDLDLTATTPELSYSSVASSSLVELESAGGAATDAGAMLSMSSGFAQDLRDAAAQAQEMLDSVAGVANGAAGAATDPLVAARQLAGVLGYAAGAAWDVEQAMRSKVDAARCAGEDIWKVGVGAACAGAWVGRQVRRAFRAVRHNSARRSAELLQASSPDLKAVVRARPGDDLRALATRHYGTPSSWRALAKFNGLYSSNLADGQVVLIPAKLPTDVGFAGGS